MSGPKLNVPGWSGVCHLPDGRIEDCQFATIPGFIEKAEADPNTFVITYTLGPLTDNLIQRAADPNCSQQDMEALVKRLELLEERSIALKVTSP